MSGSRIWVFGEVLFDHFPDGSRVLGGAPFNVAWHLQAFGQRPLLISRVGDDPEGAEVRAAMRDWGMDTAALQTDPALPTGRVSVRLVNGEPHYTIDRPVAWDAIAAPEDPATLGAPRLLYHGTLALREPAPRGALQRLQSLGPPIVFVDVNLREPFWEREEVKAWLHAAHWGKLNRDELGRLSRTPAAADAQGRALIEECGLDGLVLTHGPQGAEGFTPGGGRIRSAQRRVRRLVDTVGAGDAFAAVMILGLVSGWELESMLNRANAFARAVCGRRGATAREPEVYRHFMDEWGLAPAPD